MEFGTKLLRRNVSQFDTLKLNSILRFLYSAEDCSSVGTFNIFKLCLLLSKQSYSFAVLAAYNIVVAVFFILVEASRLSLCDFPRAYVKQ